MKSIIKKKAEPGLWLEDSPIPTIKDNEVLIKIHKTSICGTDVTIHKWEPWAQKNVPIPLIVGHEFVGEIVELGKNVKGFTLGARVTGEGHITCGICSNCKKGDRHLCSNVRGVGYHVPGCFAEYMTLPAENVFLLPDYVSDDIAAIFDPYGNAMHTALSNELVGEDILITGAGPIGIMAAAIARKAGARNVVITDINDYRLDLAKKMGANEAINVTRESLKSAMEKLGMDEGFSVGMEMSGSAQAFNSLIDSCRYGANIALLGILPPGTAIDWDKVIFPMLTIKGIYGREIFSTWFKMTSLIQAGLDLSPIITHRFSVEEFEKGIEAMKSGQCGKVILDWQ